MSDTSTTSRARLAKVESRLGYQFADPTLLEQALTHKSHSRRHNERLEFLGDAVLGCIIAEALYDQHPGLNEDALTLLRAELVRRDTLAGLAGQIGLGAFIRLGTGELKSGGRQRASILADALEAVIGAVNQDAGYPAARTLVLDLYESLLAGLDQVRIESVKDAKTQLQELLQAQSRPLPVYEVVETRGSDHNREFVVACRVESLQLATQGLGSSRRSAEKAAAELMIEVVNGRE